MTPVRRVSHTLCFMNHVCVEVLQAPLCVTRSRDTLAAAHRKFSVRHFELVVATCPAGRSQVSPPGASRGPPVSTRSAFIPFTPSALIDLIFSFIMFSGPGGPWESPAQEGQNLFRGSKHPCGSSEHKEPGFTQAGNLYQRRVFSFKFQFSSQIILPAPKIQLKCLFRKKQQEGGAKRPSFLLMTHTDTHTRRSASRKTLQAQ